MMGLKRLWPLWLLVMLLIPVSLFVYRWGEWDFQPSWLATAKFVTDFYMPWITLASVWVVIHQITNKWKADRTALLIDGFRRQCTMLELRIPRKPDNPTEAECPDHLLRSVRRKDDVGVRTDFLRDHSMFIHAILEMGRTLTRLEEVEPVAASMLRMELFMTIKRDHFIKYEEICIALVSPNDYKKVCE